MSTVKIINTYWNILHLQVRVGDKEPAERNPLIFDRTLQKGEEVDFDFDVLLFYRRDTNPDNPDGMYTSWTECFTDQIIDNP